MGLFGKKKETEAASACDCGGACAPAAAASADSGNATVKVLGSGCKKCNDLEAAVKEALQSLGLAPEVDHVTDFGQIAAYGVMTTPALVVGGKVVSTGKVLKAAEAAALIKAAL